LENFVPGAPAAPRIAVTGQAVLNAPDVYGSFTRLP